MNVQIYIRKMPESHVVKQMVLELCDEIKNTCDDIQYIDVKIEDINGPHKTGIDKHCHLKVRGKERMAIDIEEIDADLDCAIDNAFQRLQKVLKRSKVYKIPDEGSIIDPDEMYSL